MEHEFDPEPIRELPAGEPPTPLWLPVVGVIALLALAGWWLSGPDEPEPGAPAASASAAASAAASVAPAASAGARP